VLGKPKVKKVLREISGIGVGSSFRFSFTVKSTFATTVVFLVTVETGLGVGFAEAFLDGFTDIAVVAELAVVFLFSILYCGI
jgi:hypothetical protein